MEWSEMLPELLAIIASKYITCYEDYPSFAGVCRSWRLAAARTYHNSNGPPSQLPSLMLASKSGYPESRELFLLSNKRIRKIRLPEAYGKICMSSCGWLLTVGKDFATQLINPLSREIINLPKANTFPKTKYTLVWDGSISRVFLLMESKLVLVIYDLGSRAKLGFCHIGDNKWTSVEQPFTNSIFDITFYNGQVYAFETGKIQACNVNGKHPTLVDVTMIPEDFYDLDDHVGSRSAYIVGQDDGERKQVLVIMKFFNLNKTKGFKVLAYDLESGNWSKVKDFGRKTLFVGCCSTFWTEDTTGVIKGNCIYYKEGGRDTGIYHMSDGTIEPHFTGESHGCRSKKKGKSRSRYTPPWELIIWLQSM